MTYDELFKKLEDMPQEKRQSTDVAVLGHEDEILPVTKFVTDWNEGEEDPAEDVLDEGHPYFIVDW